MENMNPDLPPAPAPKRPNFRPVLITLLCSVLLGAGSCFGFLTTLNTNESSTINLALAVLFLLCVATFLGSVVMLIVKAFANR
jgi:hypothetical protein